MPKLAPKEFRSSPAKGFPISTTTKVVWGCSPEIHALKTTVGIYRTLATVDGLLHSNFLFDIEGEAGAARQHDRTLFIATSSSTIS